MTAFIHFPLPTQHSSLVTRNLISFLVTLIICLIAFEVVTDRQCHVFPRHRTQGFSISVRFNTFPNDHHNRFSCHLSPYKHTTLLSTIFPTLYILYPCLIYSVTRSLHLLIFLLYFSLLLASHHSNHLLFSPYLQLCSVLLCLFIQFLDSTYKQTHKVFRFF